MKTLVREFVAALALLIWLSQTTANAQAVIGVVEDGPLPRPIVPLSQLANEIRGLAGDEYAVDMPANKRLDGGWTVEGVRAAIHRLLDDPDVDIVIT